MVRMILVALMLLAWTRPSNAQGPAPRVDELGDPLPPGAIARLGTGRLKHHVSEFSRFAGQFNGGIQGTTITGLDFSPNGKAIVSNAMLDSYRPIAMWDRDSGKQLTGPWSAANADIVIGKSFTFSPNGTYLATQGFSQEATGFRRRIAIWNLAERKDVRLLQPANDVGNVDGMSFESDGKTLITNEWDYQDEGNITAIVRWQDVETGMERKKWKFPTGRASEFGPNGDWFIHYGVISCICPKAVLFRISKTERTEDRFQTLSEMETVLISLREGPQFGKVIHRTMVYGNPTGRGAYSFFTPVFSGDGASIAMQGVRRSIEIRDSTNGKLIQEVQIPADWTINNSSLSLSHDGSLLAFTEQGARTVLWRKGDATFTAFDTHMPYIQATALSPDGKTLAIGAGCEIRLFDTATLAEIHAWPGHHEEVRDVMFSADGASLWSSTENERIAWDGASWKKIAVGGPRTWKAKNIDSVSAYERYFTSSDPKEMLDIFDLASGALRGRVKVLPSQEVRGSGFFSRDGNYYFLPVKTNKVGGDLLLYSAHSCKLIAQLPGLSTYPYHPDNRGNLLQIGPARTSVAADGRVVAVLDQQRMIQVIDTSSGKVLQRLGEPRGQNERFFKLVLSDDGRMLAESNGMNKQLRVWDLKTGRPLLTIELGDGLPQPCAMAWSPDGRMLAVANRKIQVWEIETRKLRAELNEGGAAVQGLAFSPNGRLLASGGMDTTVLIWDLWGL